MPFQFFFKRLSFNNQVVVLVALLGVLRVMLGIINDIINNTVTVAEFMLDTSFILLFLYLFFYALSERQIKKIPVIIGLIFIALVAINFVQLGKTAGLSEFNYYTGFIGIIVLYEGRRLYVLLTLQFMIMIALIATDYVGFDNINKAFFVVETDNSIGFLFAIVTTVALTFYLQRIIKGEVAKYRKVNQELNEKIALFKLKNIELEQKSAELNAIQKHLHSEINSRSSLLRNQNEAIENFLKYNTEELIEPLARLSREVSRLPKGNPLHDMTHEASQELNSIAGNLQKVILSGEAVERTKIIMR